MRKFTIWASTAAVAVLLANILVGTVADPHPVEFMQAEARRIGGWAENELVLAGGGGCNGLLWGQAQTVWKTQDGKQTVHVKMVRPLHLLGWQLAEYRVEE